MESSETPVLLGWDALFSLRTYTEPPTATLNQEQLNVKFLPFKIANPLLTMIAQLVDVHHASVPHDMSGVDEVAWEEKSWEGEFNTCE